MPGIFRSFLPLVILCAALAGSAAAPPILAEGDNLGPLTLPDQHGREHRIDAAVRVLLFSRDMDGGRVIRGMLDPETLGEAPTAFLGRQRAVCVADIHRMPGLIRRAIAKPRMRKRPYPLLLDETGDATAAWPSADSRATLIRLEGSRIVDVAHFEEPEALRAALAFPGGQPEVP